jgi:hypothetical protein
MYINATVPDAGLIGSWSPGIGDPTVAGWATTFLYFATVVQIWRVMRRIDSASFEYTVWWLLLVCMFALGVNKQLDLQTALTEIGRIVAHKQGWYDDRQEVQKMFIAGLCGAAAAGCVARSSSVIARPNSARRNTNQACQVSGFRNHRANNVGWSIASRIVPARSLMDGLVPTQR